MAIKIAVTAQNRKTVSSHAGACRNYFIYTINNDGSYEKELLELAKEESLRFTFHDDESENPQNKIFEMDVVLTGGIGQGGVKKLAQRNVIARVINETDPDVAIEKYLNRTLEFLEPENHHKKEHNH
jgi:predicted Fe-Mo cluster-binding NifX family protein